MNVAPDNAAPFAAQRDGDWLKGPWRRPTNNSSHEAGTIHDDITARALGFRSGTVAGSIHMEQFVPLMVAAFGPAWQRTGSLSLWFCAPSTGGEPVQAMVQTMVRTMVQAGGPGDSTRAARMLTNGGVEVMHGTASAGLDPNGEVRQRLARQRSGAPPRMLAGIAPGFAARGLPTQVPQADIARRLPFITERRSAFSQPNAHGVCEVPLSAAVHTMRVFEAQLPVARSGFVGLFGAIEWQWLSGPMWADRTYEVSGTVLALGDSPRSEMLWTETTLHDPELRQDVARMLMLSRLLKDSSPLWQTASSHL